ncbi:hypothetical protein BGP_6292 [Beggiatoa sp. PS]|nr:hypothetical protein BGP_6292 [Beggiatoa sp. PS]
MWSVPYFYANEKNMPDKSRLCAACGSSTTRAKGWENEDLRMCDSTGMWAWRCSECEFIFHLDETYPTSNIEYCPKCKGHPVSPVHDW